MSNCLSNNYISYVESHHVTLHKMLESLRENRGWIAACGKIQQMKLERFGIFLFEVMTWFRILTSRKLDRKSQKLP